MPRSRKCRPRSTRRQTILPGDLPQAPIYNKVNPADTPILTLALTSKTLPLPNIQYLADTRLAAKLSQVSGVGLVSISGGQRPSVRVQANPTALAAYGLVARRPAHRDRQCELEPVQGQLRRARPGSSTIEANSQLRSAEEFKTDDRRLSQRRGGAAG